MSSGTGNVDVVDVTLSLTATTYDAGDVLAAAQEIKNFMRVPGASGTIKSLLLTDKDDQGIPMTLYLFDSAVAIGAEDAAASWEDADSASILARIPISGPDYIDLTNNQIVVKNDLDIPIKSAAGTRSIWVAAVTGGTPTHTASGITLKIGVDRN